MGWSFIFDFFFLGEETCQGGIDGCVTSQSIHTRGSLDGSVAMIASIGDSMFRSLNSVR